NRRSPEHLLGELRVNVRQQPGHFRVIHPRLIKCRFIINVEAVVKTGKFVVAHGVLLGFGYWISPGLLTPSFSKPGLVWGGADYEARSRLRTASRAVVSVVMPRMRRDSKKSNSVLIASMRRASLMLNFRALEFEISIP